MNFNLFPKDLIFHIASFLKDPQDIVRLSLLNKYFYTTLTGKILTNNIPTTPDNRPNNTIKLLKLHHQIAKWFIEQGYLPPKYYHLTSTWQLIQKLSRIQAANLWEKIANHVSPEAKNITNGRNEVDIDLYHKKIQIFSALIETYFTKILQTPFQMKLNKIILVETSMKLDFQKLATAIKENDEFFGLEYFIILSCLEVIPGNDAFHQTCYLAGFELINTSFNILQLITKINFTQHLLVSNCINKFCNELIKITHAQLEPANIELLQNFINTILTTRYYCENRPIPIQQFHTKLQPRFLRLTLKPKINLLYQALESILHDKSLLTEFITLLSNSEKTQAINNFFHLVNNPILATLQPNAPIIRTDLQK